MTVPEPGSDVVEVVLALSRSSRGRTVVEVRSTRPALDYGTVDLVELPLLLEALVTDLAAEGEPEP